MMDCYLDTRKVTHQQLQEYAKQLLIFINEYEWLTHAYIVEFFRKNHWSSLPVIWQQCLQGITPPQVADLVVNDNRTKARHVWPLSLLAYRATAAALSISQFMSPKSTEQRGADTIIDTIDFSHCYRLHVKPKKRHEIDELGKVINSTCCTTHCRRVVDVGSGQGHLSRLLSFGYGLPVTSIEAVGCHITGAAKFDREVKDFIEKKNKKYAEPYEAVGNKSLLPEHVVCTVHPQITVEEFLSVINTSCRQLEAEDTNIIHRCEVSASEVNKCRMLSDDSISEKIKSLHENRIETRKIIDNESEKNCTEKDAFLLAGLHTCGDLGPTMLRVFAKCNTAYALASVACCYMKMSCAMENSLARCKSKFQLSNTCAANLGLKSEKNETVFGEDFAGIRSGNNISGFPMSQWIKGQKGCDLDFEPLELACHSFHAYCKRLKENDPNLVIQGYRAMLEILIHRQEPSLTQKHAGIRKIKRALGSIKKGYQIPFEDYASAALQKLDLEDDREASRELSDRFLPQWHSLVVFHTIRLLLGPVLESLVLVDRVLYLLEQGIDSKLVPIFDPLISPRNFVLLATKRRQARCSGEFRSYQTGQDHN